jgi:hypothetical protein
MVCAWLVVEPTLNATVALEIDGVLRQKATDSVDDLKEICDGPGPVRSAVPFVPLGVGAKGTCASASHPRPRTNAQQDYGLDVCLKWSNVNWNSSTKRLSGCAEIALVEDRTRPEISVFELHLGCFDLHA